MVFQSEVHGAKCQPVSRQIEPQAQQLAVTTDSFGVLKQD